VTFVPTASVDVSSEGSFAVAAAGATSASLVVAGGAAVVTASSIPDTLPSAAVSVSRGGTLNPTAAAEANQRDNSAVRTFSSVEIRAPNGQCLFVDPTAGDFRENLIPVGLVDCGGTPNEKWDVISKGIHNDRPNSAMIVSSLVSRTLNVERNKVKVSGHGDNRTRLTRASRSKDVSASTVEGQ
jgi:hypothetical protein